MQYELEGGTVFLANRRIHVYSPELKLQSVQEYLSGNGSLYNHSLQKEREKELAVTAQRELTLIRHTRRHPKDRLPEERFFFIFSSKTVIASTSFVLKTTSLYCCIKYDGQWVPRFFSQTLPSCVTILPKEKRMKSSEEAAMPR